jgi:hypothetical protein
MRDVTFCICCFVIAGIFIGVLHQDGERVVVDPWMYEFADKQCEKGWRKITVTEKSIGVHCHGGGLHVLDWSMRRVANAD